MLHESQNFRLQRTRDAASCSRDDHIDFGPDAEIGKVHARFDRKPRAGQQAAVVVGFVVVHVDAVPCTVSPRLCPVRCRISAP